MDIQLKHFGMIRREDRYLHQYFAFAPLNGWADMYEDEDFVPNGIYDLPDDMFQLDSQEYDWQCDGCGIVFTQRSRPGGRIICPVCAIEGVVPNV